MNPQRFTLIAALALAAPLARAQGPDVPATSPTAAVAPLCVAATAEPWASLAATPEAWWATQHPWREVARGRFDLPRPAYDEKRLARFRRLFRAPRGAGPGEIGIAVALAEYHVAKETLDGGEVDLGRALLKSALAKLILLNQAHSTKQLNAPPNKVGTLASLLGTAIERWLQLHGLFTDRGSVHTGGRPTKETYQSFPISLESAEADPFPLRRQLTDIARGHGKPIRFHFVPGSAVGEREGSNKTTALESPDGTVQDIAVTLEALLDLELAAPSIAQIKRGLQVMRFTDQGKATAYEGTFFGSEKGRIVRLGSFGAIYGNGVPQLPDETATLDDKIPAIQSIAGEVGQELVNIHQLRSNYADTRHDLSMWYAMFSAVRNLDSFQSEVSFRGDSVEISVSVDAGKHGMRRLLMVLPPRHGDVLVGFPRLSYGVRSGDDDLGDTVRLLRAELLNRKPKALDWEEKELAWRLVQHMQRRLDFSWFSALYRAEQREKLVQPLLDFVRSPSEAAYVALARDLRAVEDPALQKRSLRGIEYPKPGGDPVALPAGPAEGTVYVPMHTAVAAYRAATPGRARSLVLEQIAMDAAMHYAAARGWYVLDISRDQQGADLVIIDLRRQQRWLVEVKGRGPNSPELDFTPEEVATAREYASRWLLAIVTVDADGIARLHWRRNVPFRSMDELESRRVLSVDRVLERLPSIALPSPWER